MVQRNLQSSIEDFLHKETAGGILLMFATALALVVANSPLTGLYDALLNVPVEIRIGALHIAKPLLLWINDGLMAVFFFQVGLELKRELLEGELSSPQKLVLPVIAAVGGILIPSGIYAFINWGDPVAIKGWAIPAATDIAFALGVLALLGKSVPTALKVFLVSLAIIDDIGAILIIAVFYTAQLSYASLLFGLFVILVLLVLNLRGVTNIVPYILLGVVLWIAVLKSGVHATLAGVALAFFIPLRTKNEAGHSPLRELEHNLHPSVAFVILPVFAFSNAGISFADVSLQSVLEPVPIGIALGLVIGKQLGVFGFSWIAIKLGIASLPENVSWSALYGVAILTGIGFTMSLFIGTLAFEFGGPENIDDRMGILPGSLISAFAGYFVLKYTLKRSNNKIAVGT